MEARGFQDKMIREPAYAGKFYPGTKKELTDQLKKLFSDSKKCISKSRPSAIISPHAGYVFSGRVAASAYNQIPENENYKKIFILASSHQFMFGGAAVFDAGNYKTPLGEVEVDTELARQLIESNKIFISNTEAHRLEHSLEVQLPFLQYKLKNNLLIVPIILGTNDPSECRKIAKALEAFYTPENLFVISSDFSHYPSYEDAVENDLQTALAICSNKPEKLLQVLDSNKRKNISHLVTSLCGWTSVLTLLYITEHKNVVYQKIFYQNSGDNEYYGDKDRVVGYWGLVVLDRDRSFSITREEQKILLAKARESITNFLKTGSRKIAEPSSTDNILTKHAGVFVSIYINKELRGCIGNFAKDETLCDMVQRLAVSAACDYRFEDIRPDELPDMELEISILTPLQIIESIDNIVLGKHGILIKKGPRSGTFLPQVATKTGWNLYEFLGHCARDKAGIGWEGWKDKDSEIFTYEAFVFKD
jgi:MEMO1 family protein